MNLDSPHDAVVVGARCAGAPLAVRLARAGWRVALIDRDPFPSDTLSTHTMFPDTLDELEQLGAMDRLRSRHRLRPVRFSWRVLGQEVAGTFTPYGVHDRALSVRRVSLDAVLVELAGEAGADLHLGRRVVDVLGSGTEPDPARGVVLDNGAHLPARWVLAADGRRSVVARRLGLTVERELRGGMAMLLGYWSGLPASDWCHLDVHADRALMSVPVEDGLHLLAVGSDPGLTRGPAPVLEERYLALVRSFPGVLNPRLLDTAALVGPVAAAPETMLRGFHRPAAGPGWATLGDAGHFKHPATAQGIGDAVTQARYVAEDLLAGGTLADYARWRDERAAGHYEWSFAASRPPTPEARGLYAGIAADPDAAQGFLDTFTKRTRPDEVVTEERSRRWRAAAAFEEGVEQLCALLAGLPPAAEDTRVPACPDWTVRDLTSHLVGATADSARGEFYEAADRAWRDDAAAVARERWTAGHVAARRGRGLAQLLDDLCHHGRALVHVLRGGGEPAAHNPALQLGPVADLAVHLDDLREALGAPPDPDGALTRLGFAIYREWLRSRLVETGAGSLVLSDGTRTWQLGEGTPTATLTADRQELFRIITGRRSEAAIRGQQWDGDPAPYLPVISPYPLAS